MKVTIESLDANDALTIAARLGYSNHSISPMEYIENYLESCLMDILRSAKIESKMATLREDVQKELSAKYDKKKKG